MLTAIRLHHKAAMHAGEIRDIRPNWMLASELVSGQTAAAQQLPEPLFSLGGASAQRAGANDLHTAMVRREI